MKRRALTWIAAVALPLTMIAAPGYTARDDRQTLQHDGRKLELSIDPQFSRAMHDNLQQWVDFISKSLLQVYGRWPRERWQIRIVPASAAADDPIPWAQVHRDTVDSVEFFTSTQATSQELKQAWTGYHELSHLLIPYRGWGDIWFSEGMASFYQNILMARSGILNEQQMWQRLYEGFRRAQADTQFDGQTLAVVSDSLRKKGGFMRVYWSGAWYFLAIDIRLRLQSGGKLTLDRALEKLNRCCADQSLSVPEIVDKLDEMNQVLLFRPLYERINISTELPSFESIFASLGITLGGKEVILQQEGPGARLRRQIIRPLAL